MAQKRTQRTKVTKEEVQKDETVVEDAAVAEAKTRDDAVTVEDADDWLDTIDEALEDWAATSELAQAFVNSYVQKGGE